MNDPDQIERLVRDEVNNAPTVPTTRAGAVVQLARLRLAVSPYPALQRLECFFDEGVLTIRGSVSTFHERQMAWITLCDLTDVEKFIDHVEVIERDQARNAEAQRAAL